MVMVLLCGAAPVGAVAVLSASESSELDFSESMAATAAFSVDKRRFLVLVDAFFLTVMVLGKRAVAVMRGGGGAVMVVIALSDCREASEGDRETVRETASPSTGTAAAAASCDDDEAMGGGPAPPCCCCCG